MNTFAHHFVLPSPKLVSRLGYVQKSWSIAKEKIAKSTVNGWVSDGIPIYHAKKCSTWKIIAAKLANYHYFQYLMLLHMTLCEILWWKQSQRWTKVKVVKWCWNDWNGHCLVYIYHKQCGILQKNQWKGSNGQLHWFNKATSGALFWKRQKNTKNLRN